MTYTIKPTGRRVLVKIVRDETISKAGIIIPDTVDRMARRCQGEVVALGQGLSEHERTEVQIGEIVMFDEWSGIEVKYPKPDKQEGQRVDYQIVPFDNLLATTTI